MVKQAAEGEQIVVGPVAAMAGLVAIGSAALGAGVVAARYVVQAANDGSLRLDVDLVANGLRWLAREVSK